MEIVDTAPDEFLASVADASTRADLERLDALITAALPGRDRVLWEGVFWGGTDQSIIGYGHLRQERRSGPPVEWFLVGLAVQKNHYSVYVNAVDDGAYLIKKYEDRLGKVQLGAAKIGFRRLDDVDLDVLTALIERAGQISPPDQRAG